MISTIHCITGRVKKDEGIYCQDCNAFHDFGDDGLPPLRVSVRTVAHMLHNGEITPEDAALTLFILTEEPTKKKIHKHD